LRLRRRCAADGDVRVVTERAAIGRLYRQSGRLHYDALASVPWEWFLLPFTRQRWVLVLRLLRMLRIVRWASLAAATAAA
jgi:hypothetical protein